MVQLDPGAIARGEGGPAPSFGPAWPLVSGSTQGVTTEYFTQAANPSTDRLQLLAVVNTFNTVLAAPNNISGAGIPWFLVDSIQIGTRLMLSLWRAMGNTVGGPLRISYPTPQSDCSWSWTEFSDVITGNNGANTIIQAHKFLLDPVVSWPFLINMGPFASLSNQTYGAFAHSKGGNEPPFPSIGTGFQLLHHTTAGIGMQYTASLATQHRPDNDQTVDIAWNLAGSVAGIAVELGDMNVKNAQVLSDSVILARMVSTVDVDTFIKLANSTLVNTDGVVKGPVSVQCESDAVVDQAGSWVKVPKIPPGGWSSP